MASKNTRYINRELSWLEFNQRVLDEARNDTVPMLERLKFIAITSSNLDEFFMVRVGGLKILDVSESTKKDPSGMTAREQLEEIDRRVHQMVAEQYASYNEEIEPALKNERIKRIRCDEMSDEQASYVQELFDEELYSILTPMAVSSREDFPLLVNRTLNIAVRLKAEGADGKPRFAVMPLASGLSRFIQVPAQDGFSYVLLEDVICSLMHRFFPGQEVIECVPFRITRNADMRVEEDMNADLLSGMEDILSDRKRSDCVRLEIDKNCTKALLNFLQRVLNVRDEVTYNIDGPLDLSSFMKLTGLEGFPKLKNESWPPQPSPLVDSKESLFDTLSQRSLLLYHPYESFDPVLRLLEEAADDKDVLAIKQILYRTSSRSPVVAALMRAAEKGKHVTVIVELKARFDEARNIEWANELEEAGVQVIYGVKGLKTHAKVCMVVRREAGGIQRYIHFGTGNYNEATSKLYTDISYMTCDEDLAVDAATFFNTITGYSVPQKYRKIEAAPISMRDRLLELIDGEIRRKKDGQKAMIMAKFNSLADPALINALYKASRAGVKIRLNVRGICCLRPGVRGRSENITVVSIVDRFLEHARIFYFYHGGDELVFISSADWMPRNLDRRIELLVPVEEPNSRRRLISILTAHFNDTVKAKKLLADGTYKRVAAMGRRKVVRCQEYFYKEACRAYDEERKSQFTVFEPHRPPAAEA